MHLIISSFRTFSGPLVIFQCKFTVQLSLFCTVGNCSNSYCSHSRSLSISTNLHCWPRGSDNNNKTFWTVLAQCSSVFVETELFDCWCYLATNLFTLKTALELSWVELIKALFMWWFDQFYIRENRGICKNKIGRIKELPKIALRVDYAVSFFSQMLTYDGKI